MTTQTETRLCEEALVQWPQERQVECVPVAIVQHNDLQKVYKMNLYISVLTLGAVWLYLFPGAEVHLPLSMVLHLLGPVASDLPIGDVLKTQT